MVSSEVARIPKPDTARARALYDTVIAGGCCIGCGICTAPAGSPFAVELNADGFFVARWKPDLPAITPNGTPTELALPEPDYEALCPFGERAVDESRLAAELYPEAPVHPRVGRYLACRAGWVEHGAYRAEGSSGGFAKWLLAELLERGEVDHVIQVHRHRPEGPGDLLYAFGVSRTPEEVRRGSRSSYYPVELSAMLRHIRETPGRYAVTGVPCFIKALRLLMRQDAVYRDRIRYTVGIVCGHLKSTQYAEMLGWQLGVPPDELGGVEFRHKIPGARANEKGVTAWARGREDQPSEPRKVQQLFGTNYGEGLFKYRACDYCDDVLAETADVAVGDAWLPRFMGQGTNILVIRHPRLLEIATEAVAAGRLHLEPVSAEEVAESQNAGLRHRREGLAYRLWLRQQTGAWTPRKRVAPDRHGVSGPTQRVMQARLRLAEESLTAFAEAKRAGSLGLFLAKMRPAVRDYYAVLNRVSRKLADRLWNLRTRWRERTERRP